ncbi:MAG: hypothetical protein LBL21_04320 [Rickettsiales bacterium]|jgi:hypothetical protein|nr:hypothetical protein [Rickettsiales bacterium]
MTISKSLLILGHPRSGKTTLGDMICDKYNLSFISIDALVQTFREILPELGMHHEAGKSEAALAPFLFKYMDRIKHKSVYRQFIIEGCHIRPKTADRMMNKDKYRLVALGCPSLTPGQFAEAIKKNDKPYDWTSGKDDEELYQMAADYISEAKRTEAECAELGLTFIDTSFDREAKLNDFLRNLGTFLK